MKNKRILLLVECVILFTLLPIVIYLSQSRQVMIAIVWGSALVTGYVLLRKNNSSIGKEWGWQAVNFKNLKSILIKFVPVSIALMVFVLIEMPDKFLNLPLDRPVVWFLVMLLYPILSVMPQCIIFRSYFFGRYETALGGSATAVILSGVTFGYAHFFLGNMIAIILCTVGGIAFAYTYKQSRSLALVCIEHSLYGCYVFTIGLGQYFFSGAHLHH